MKQIILQTLVIVLYMNIRVWAQDQIIDHSTSVIQTAPFITSDKEWVVHYESFISPVDNGIRTYSFHETQDTVEGTPLYELVYNTPINANLINTKYYYREKDGQVFMHYQNGYEVLMYDFTAQVRDTIVRYPDRPLFNLIVTQIDTVVYSDLKPRKRISLLCELEDNSIYYWIEGMGGDRRFLDESICSIIDSPALFLRCFFENGVKVYQDSLVQNCFILKVDDIENNDEIIIYPNPAFHTINIESYAEIKQILIYNQIGQLIAKKENTSKNIDISALPSGIYTIEVTQKGSEFHRAIKRIIKI